MKKSIIILTLLMVFVSSKAFGMPFGDSTGYWSGWPSWQSSDNDLDQTGVPISPGTVLNPGSPAGWYDIVGGKLHRIEFNYRSHGHRSHGHQSHGHRSHGHRFEFYVRPMDLFVDKGADHTWDYGVNLYGVDTGAGTYQMDWIPLSSEAGTSGYVLSGAAWAASGIHDPDHDDIGNWHPVAIDGSVLKSDPHGAYFDGWKYGSGSHTTYFGFGPGGLDFGHGPFEFSWTINCGNVVVQEHGNIPTPEPATMFLLGSGLIGLGGLARRKFKK